MSVSVKKEKSNTDQESEYTKEELRRLIDKGTTGEIKKDLNQFLALARSGEARRIKKQ
jgi:hypothetical protein